MLILSLNRDRTIADLASNISCEFANSCALNTPRLASMDNFRDIAGLNTAYCTPYGSLRAGAFYRSNAVTPSANDMLTLENLGIRAIFDLRAKVEISEHPDRLPASARYRHFDVLASRFENFDPATFVLDSAEQAAAIMVDVNRDFVTSAPVREVLAQVLGAMAETQGPVLFHCSAGKDRTGWVAALLHSIAGVDTCTIMADYLATNTYTAQRVNATLSAMGEKAASIHAPALVVQERYINAAFEEISSHYGSMENYLQDGLNLSRQTLRDLRSKLIQ